MKELFKAFNAAHSINISVEPRCYDPVAEETYRFDHGQFVVRESEKYARIMVQDAVYRQRDEARQVAMTLVSGVRCQFTQDTCDGSGCPHCAAVIKAKSWIAEKAWG